MPSPSLLISVLALIFATTPLANAARKAVGHAVSSIAGHRVSTKPYAGGILLLGKNRKFPAAAIPTVKNSSEVGG